MGSILQLLHVRRMVILFKNSIKISCLFFRVYGAYNKSCLLDGGVKDVSFYLSDARALG